MDFKRLVILFRNVFVEITSQCPIVRAGAVLLALFHQLRMPCNILPIQAALTQPQVTSRAARLRVNTSAIHLLVFKCLQAALRLAALKGRTGLVWDVEARHVAALLQESLGELDPVAPPAGVRSEGPIDQCMLFNHD